MPYEARAVYRLLEIGIKQGILLYTRKTAGGAYGEWVMVTPALNINEIEVDELIDKLSKSITELEVELQNKDFI